MTATTRALPLLLMLAALPGCERSRPERVVLGVALTASDHPAIKLAVEEINAAGGIDGVPLEIEGLEWKFSMTTEPEILLEWADRLSANPELLAVVGHSDSASTLAASALYSHREIPQIVTIASHRSVTQLGPRIYRIGISDDRQGRLLAAHAIRDLGKQRIAVFHVADDYGRGVVDMFEDEAERLGGTVVARTQHNDAIDDDDRDLIASVIRRLKTEERPDLILLAQRKEAALFTIGQIRSAGLDVTILGTDSLAHEATRNAAPAITDGVRVVEFHVPEQGDPRSERFRQRMKEITGHAPDYSEAFAYDAVYLFRDAVLGGGFSREGVTGYLDGLAARGQEVRGVGGRYSFDADRNARREVRIVELNADDPKTQAIFQSPSR